MNNKANERNVQDITRRFNDDAFENMCVHIYEEVYFSPGARRYGRRGQKQHGKDILLHDFRTSTIDRRGGMVLVQCKYTDKDELDFHNIKSDVLIARDRVNSTAAYRGVYLFVVATTAKNDTGLHDRLQELKEVEQLPFQIELHSWDKLCSHIQASTRLWDVYSDPSKEVPVQFRLQVDLLAGGIADKVAGGLLEDASVDVRRWKSGLVAPYGRDGARLPPDIWMQSPHLRKALLDLYTEAADAWESVELLEYEWNLGNLQNADHCLAYLLAQRIAENLRSPVRLFPHVGDEPQFASSLVRLSAAICQTQGSPDDLGCLALLLIMETGDPSIHERGLGLMRDLVNRSLRTQWELEARIAHAVVRFFYVARRGWAPDAAHYALGDSIEGDRWIGPSDSLLDTPFHERSRVTCIAGVNPLALWSADDQAGILVLERLSRLIGDDDAVATLPKLAAQCRNYSRVTGEASRMAFSLKGKSELLWTVRVVLADTLVALAADRTLGEVLGRFHVVATERTFERLLGYRAYLRACVEQAGAWAVGSEQLERIEGLIRSCRISKGPIMATGVVWITAVYYNVAENLAGISASNGRPEVDRRGEVSLGHLLALSRSAPLLAFQDDEFAAAAKGVQVEHPYQFRNRGPSFG